MENEIDRIQKILKCSQIIKTLGNSLCLENVLKALPSLTSFEAPDGFATLENEVLLLEHFRFNSSKMGKKGSKQNIENARIERDFEKIPIPDLKGICSVYEMQLDYSTEYYKNNLIAQYNNHYSKIDNYIQNLKCHGIIKESTIITSLFFIEEDSEFGSMYYNEALGESTPLAPVHCSFFQELFVNSPKLDAVICSCTPLGEEYQLWYMDKENVEEFKKHGIEIDNIEIYNFHPQSYGFKQKIDGNHILS